MLPHTVVFDGRSSLKSFRILSSILLFSIFVSVSAQNNISCPDAAADTVYTNTNGNNYTLFCGYDWTQDIVAFPDTPTFEDCLLRCDSFVPGAGQYACGAVAWSEQETRTCYLKPSMADGGRLGPQRPGVYTGVKGVPESVTGPPIPACPTSNNTIYTDANSHNYTVRCGLDTKGNDYYNASSVPQYGFLYPTNQFGSYQECFYQCGLRPGCLGFTWEGLEGAENGTGRGGCYFKQQANDCNPVVYNFYLDRQEIYNNTYVSALREDQAQLINNTCIPCSASGTVSLCPTASSTAVLPPQTASATSSIPSATPSICPTADGTIYTDTSGQRYTIYCSDGVLGDSIDLADIPSFDACLSQCSQYGSGCGSAVYASGISYCYLKPPVEQGGIRSGGLDQVGVKYFDATTTLLSTTTAVPASSGSETIPAITVTPVSATLTTSTVVSSSSAVPVCPVPDGDSYIDSNGQPYRFYCSAGWGGNVAVIPDITSFDACAVACDNYADNTGSNTCGAVVWDGLNACYLKPASGVAVIGIGGLESGTDNVGEKIVQSTSTNSLVPISTPGFFSTTITATPVSSTTPVIQSPTASSIPESTDFSSTVTETPIPTIPSSSIELLSTTNSGSSEPITSSDVNSESPPPYSAPLAPTSATVSTSRETSSSVTGTGIFSGSSSVSSLVAPPSYSIPELPVSTTNTPRVGSLSSTPSPSSTQPPSSTAIVSTSLSTSGSSSEQITITPPSSFMNEPIYPTPTPETSFAQNLPSYPGGTPPTMVSSAASSTTAVAACTSTGQHMFTSGGYEYDFQCGAVISDDRTHLNLDVAVSDSYTQCFAFCNSAAACYAFTYSGAVTGNGPGICSLFLERSNGSGSSSLSFSAGESTNVGAIRRRAAATVPPSASITTTTPTAATSSCVATGASTIVSPAGSTYRMQCGAQISGGILLASIEVEGDSQACYAFCDANVECEAFSYEVLQRRCVLLARGTTGGSPNFASLVGGDTAEYFAALKITTRLPTDDASTVYVTPIPSPPMTGTPTGSSAMITSNGVNSTNTIATFITASGLLQSGCVRRTTVIAITI